ncbi:MAG: hypothetical protein WKG01_28535, partial [Kofleriaceae bacterium]
MPRSPDPDAPVPRLPRAAARGFRPSSGALFKIAITAGVLVMVVIVQRPCADSVSGFVTSFDGSGSQGSAASAIPKPGTIDPAAGSAAARGPSEVLTPEMSEAETRAAIDRVRARAEADRAQRAGSGSDDPGSADPGSACASIASAPTPLASRSWS